MKQQIPKIISAWQLMNYIRPNTKDILSELHLTKTRRMPSITRPDQLLIKVKAASLNPVDSLLIYGYGSSSFNLLRRFTTNCGYFGVPNVESSMASESSGLPLTPGRDFAGQIVDMGPGAVSSRLINQKKFTIGTNVVGATWPFLSSTGSGALAEYIVCPADYVASLPDNVSFVSAAALGYAGLTAWSALVNSGGLRPITQTSHLHNTSSSSLSANLILITGATGGVGYIAAQLAKLWGWRVHVTCPNDEKALNLMKSLEVEEVFPHPTTIPSTMKYDVIIDCVRPKYLNKVTPFSSSSSSSSNTVSEQFPLFETIFPVLPPLLSYLNTSSSRSRYVSLNPCLLYLTDQWGPILGTGLAFSQFFNAKLAAAFSVNSFNNKTPNLDIIRWAFFKPNSKALQYLLNLMSNKQLQVPIDTVYNFNQVPDAFIHLFSKTTRGKLVIEMNNG